MIELKTTRYFLSFYRPYLGTFLLDLLCAAVISGIDLIFPVLLSAFTARAVGMSASALYSILPWIIGGLLLMYCVKTVCRYYVTCQGHVMGAKMERDMRRDLFEKYMQLSSDFYDRTNTATLSSRMISDLFDISEFAHHGPENLFISVIKIVGSFAIMFSMNVKLSSVLLVITLAMAIFSFTQNKRMEETYRDNRKKIANVNASVLDSLEGIRVVKAFAREKHEMKRFFSSNDQFLKSKKENYRAMGTYYSANHFFQGMLYTAVIGAGGYLIAAGEIVPSQLAAFALYVNVFVAPIDILLEFFDSYLKGYTGFRRFEEIMDERPSIQEKPNAEVLENPRGEIVFDHVSFAYGQDDAVLDDISMIIPAGKKYSLAGPSGSGKTTICSLIPRFYDVTDGSVKIDGHDVRDLSLDSLRQAIGIVTQDVYLFDGTIADNIRCGNPEASDEEVLEAARKANLLSFIESLPDGINTRVGEKGTRLSGGQKQRISIARVFLKNPPILILDEATSALDNESEFYVQKALEDLSDNRTCLTIAHRLSTIEHSDQILVIDEKGIAEQGTHNELIEEGGLYASYVSRTFENRT